MAIRNRVFHDYVATYREAIGVTRYAQMAALQPPPFANLSEGGAGTAYALWRLGEHRRARTWITSVVADRRQAAYGRSLPANQRRGSFLFGALGARWVHAMITPAAIPAYARAIATPVDADEYADGAAGRFLGAALVLARTPDATLTRRTATIGARLATSLRTRAEAPWRPADSTGFAHGWPGIGYAALVWAERWGDHPSWIVDAIAGLAAVWTPGGVPETFVASWCNGAAGSVLLWAKAYTYSGDRRFLAIARQAARVAIDASGKLASVCCGDAGVAYALLALARVDHGRGWRDEARTLAARAIARASFRHPNGLFQGHPGLACLALELVGGAAGFPAVEA